MPKFRSCKTVKMAVLEAQNLQNLISCENVKQKILNFHTVCDNLTSLSNYVFVLIEKEAQCGNYRNLLSLALF